MKTNQLKITLDDGKEVTLKDPKEIYDLREPGIEISLLYRDGRIYTGLLKQLNLIEDEITLEKEDENIEPIVLPLDGDFIGWFRPKIEDEY